jgi:hypothetical protein
VCRNIQAPGNHPEERIGIQNTAKIWNQESHFTLHLRFCIRSPMTIVIGRNTQLCLNRGRQYEALSNGEKA